MVIGVSESIKLGVEQNNQSIPTQISIYLGFREACLKIKAQLKGI